MCDYVVVRGDTAGKQEIDAVVKLRKAIAELTGIEIEMTTDFEREGTKYVRRDKELCVGFTNREESVAAAEGLKTNDFRIKRDGTRVVIAVGSGDAADAAVGYFIENYISQKSGRIAVPEDLSYEYRHTYKLGDLKLNGRDIADFTIVGDETAAAIVQNGIAELCGVRLPVAAKSKGGPDILLTTALELGFDEVSVRSEGENLVAGTCGKLYDSSFAAEYLLKTLSAGSGKEIGNINIKEKVMNENVKIIADAELARLRAETDRRIAEILGTETKLTVKGKTYYVSSTGDDFNDGLSQKSAWKTLDRVNSAALVSGDAVLFERGGVWRGQLKGKAGVTYSAYGKGNKPKLYASPENSADEKLWDATDTKNIYVYVKNVANDVGTIVFNDGEAHAIKAVVRTETNGATFNNTTGEPFKGYADLTTDLHFYHDLKTGKVYLYSTEGNPGKRFKSIEMNIKQHVITIGGGGITVDNLCVKYGGAHGISSGTTKDLTVTNCEFGWIGGSIQAEGIFGRNYATRYGNAVEIYGGCENYTIENCYIYQVYDAAVTQQVNGKDKTIKMTNVNYVDNVMEYCNYSVEYFLSQLEEGNKSMIKDFRIAGNLMWYAGYGLSEQRPDKTEAAHIKSWSSSNPAQNYTVENNLMAFSKNMVIHIASFVDGSMPAMSGNTYIQNLGGQLGIFGVNPSGKRFSYDEKVSDTIKNTVGDDKPVIWFTEKEVKGR